MKISKKELKELSVSRFIRKDSPAWKSLKKKDLVEYDKSFREWKLNKEGEKVFMKTVPEGTKRKLCANYICSYIDLETRKEIRSKQKSRAKKKEKTTTIQERLYSKKAGFVESQLSSLLKNYEEITVCFDQDNSSIDVDTELDWDGYSKSCKYPKKLHFVSAKIEKQSRTPDAKQYDNILNLCQLSKKEKNGITVREMTWIKKRRGYAFEAVKGYIASTKGYNYHSEKSENHAVKGLKRKLKNNCVIDIKADTIITREMYTKLTGACQSGIDNFISKHNIKTDGIKAENLLPLLKNEYGYEKFKSLCVFN